MVSVHRPVLLREVLLELRLNAGLTVVDGTVGGGGHSFEILKQIEADGCLIGLDRDQTMLARAKEKLDDSKETTRVELQHSSYANLETVLNTLQISQVDRILLDLGLSSDQLADEERGFSFSSPGSLDLRFDQTTGEPTTEWLNRASEEELIHIFKEYGEEPASEALAALIVRERRGAPIQTALDLTSLVERVTSSRGSQKKSHPATRVFQALRIAANEELQQLHVFLDQQVEKCLKPGGRLAIITFHSLEDRIVKNYFRDANKWEGVTKKPIAPTPAEVRINPRSRSAKLRAGTLRFIESNS